MRILVTCATIIFLYVLISVYNDCLMMKTYGIYVKKYYEVDESKDSITVLGDSYAGYFSGYEAYKDYNFYVYAYPGNTVEENFEMMEDALKTVSDIYIVSIGVNEHNKNVNPSEFEKRIEDLIKICARNGNKIIFHTYMEYDYTHSIDFYKYQVVDYDIVLRILADKYKNAYYIDMADCDKSYLQNDRVHYNSLFYDELYNRICKLLKDF